jgi:hypothetical protein
LNFPPSRVGKGVRGLGFWWTFPHNLNCQKHLCGSKVNIAAVEPQKVKVEPQKVNVEPQKVNVEPQKVNVEPRKVKVELWNSK